MAGPPDYAKFDFGERSLGNGSRGGAWRDDEKDRRGSLIGSAGAGMSRPKKFRSRD